MFLLGSAWLAVNVWVGEQHSSVVLAAAVTVLQARPDRWARRGPVVSTATSSVSAV